MRVTQVDLNKLQPAPLYPSYDIWYRDANGNRINASQAQQKQIIGQVWDIFHTTIKRNAPVIIRAPADNHVNYSLGYTFLEEGSFNEIPDDVTSFTPFKERCNNGSLWRAAKHDKSIIVVSDYDVGSISITAKPGYSESSKFSFNNQIYLTLRKCGVVESLPGYMSIGRYFVSTGIAYTQEVRIRATRKYLAPVVPYSVDSIVASSSFYSDVGVITETVAEADTGYLDLLTALAEMPETIGSIITGFREIVRLIRDLKSRNITLSNAHTRRRDSLRRRYERDMERLLNQRRLTTSRAAQFALDRLIQNRNNSFSRANQDAIMEFNTALASIWLNFRYNIMPNVYLVEDIVKTIERYSADFITTRKSSGWTHDNILESYGWDPLVLDQRYNCVIKRGVDPKLRFNQMTLSNVITTGWELIPLSFVIDWFVNIGDFLTSISTPMIAPSEGATAGLKIEQNVVIRNSELNQSCRYDIKIYRRRVIQPISHVGLTFNGFDLSWARKIDSIALLWKPIRDLLKNLRN